MQRQVKDPKWIVFFWLGRKVQNLSNEKHMGPEDCYFPESCFIVDSELPIACFSLHSYFLLQYPTCLSHAWGCCILVGSGMMEVIYGCGYPDVPKSNLSKVMLEE